MNELIAYPYLSDRGVLGIRAGDDFVMDMTFKDQDTGDPVDLSGYAAVFQIRDGADGSLLLEDTTATGSMTIDGVNGKVSFATPRSDTAALTAGTHKWGLRLVSGDNKADTIASGVCDVAEAVVY